MEMTTLMDALCYTKSDKKIKPPRMLMTINTIKQRVNEKKKLEIVARSIFKIRKP